MKVLIVDDSKTDIMVISNMLKDYDIQVAYDGVEAMEIIEHDPDIDIMILDLNMPKMNGFEVLAAIKDNPEYQKIATVILTNYDEIDNEIRGLDLGAMDYIRKPLNIRALRKRIELHSNLLIARNNLEQQNVILERAVKARTKECNLTRDVTIQALVGLLEIRNIESSNHCSRTQSMMLAMCEQLKIKENYRSILTPDYITELYNTAPLHDIGKVGIPDSILLKPGKLTTEEFEFMKKHTVFGVEALQHAGREASNLSFIRTAIEIVGSHHEKFNGMGYPYGLKGKEIPLAGRLMAIIDVYDALVNERVYKSAYSHEAAMEIITSQSEGHFDPEIVAVFFSMEDDIIAISDKYRQT